MEPQTPVQQMPVQETQPPVQTVEKKSSVFTKWWFWFLIIIITLLSLGYFFLADLFQDSNIVLYNDNGVVEQEQQPATSETFEQEIEEEFVSWDSLDIPAIFPEYTDGDIVDSALDFDWAIGGFPNFVTVYNTSEEAAERYVNEAVTSGWEVQWEGIAMGDEVTSWAIYTEQDGVTYAALLAWYIDDRGDYLSIILTEDEG